MAKKRKAYAWQKGKTRWFWVPLQDVGQLARSQLYCDEYEDCKMLTALSDVTKDDDLIVYAHGAGANPDQVAGVPASGIVQWWTYNQLAQAVIAGIDAKLEFQIKLYICHSAERKVKSGAAAGSKKVCFAGQFFSVLKTNGFKKVKVAGYDGELVTDRADTDVQKLGKLVKIDGKYVKGTLQRTIADSYAGATFHREWFTDNLLVTRWL